ncbi:DUF5050 domain-containing protein [Paenibacillus sp. RC67]|uniref:DUF5050 domain-containing protein n=1 Tax=Paenibacillus sp. RC67 TaxID=3039392 RepID=UPI0024ADE801|nr:DUF5050 domain-containing protein [Paenibacillus sp. RC67]
MKLKKISAYLAVCMMSAIAVPQANAATDSNISITVNGVEVFADTPSFIQTDVGVTFVPIRVVSETLGANVKWNESTGSVLIKKAETELELTANQSIAKINGQNVRLEAPPVMQNGRLMVPIRFISEGLGVKVSWNQPSRTVNLGNAVEASLLFESGTGNDPQNIHNNAIVTQYNGWIYYANIGDNNKLYRMTLDQSDNVKLTDVPVTDISAVDGWIYYRIDVLEEGKRTDAGEIYRMHPDGTSNTMLSEHSTRAFFVRGDSIYYSRDRGMGAGPIYKMKLDGSERTQLSQEDDDVYEITLGDDAIYYTLNSGGLYRLELESHQATQIDSDWYHDIRIVNGWLYYKDVSGRLHRMDLNGDQRNSIGESPIGSYFIKENDIYYEKRVEGKWSTSESRLYRSDLEGNHSTQLVDKVVQNINFVGDQIYYLTYEALSSETHQYADMLFTLSRMKIDGSQKQSLSSFKMNPFPDKLRVQ